MFEVSIKINGTTIALISGVNTCHYLGQHPERENIYHVVVFDVAKKIASPLEVIHDRDSGMFVLAKEILTQYLRCKNDTNKAIV
jgi:hypothetical protein